MTPTLCGTKPHRQIMQQSNTSRLRFTGIPTVVDPIAIGFLGLALSVLHWLKLGDLASGDSVRWFEEVHRAASGEIPYRDFSWLYPPFGLWIFSWACRLFGSTFSTIQVTIDVLSVSLCLLTWVLSRKFLPRALALSISLLTALAGASNTGNFALFSLRLYAPGILTGLVGILTFLIAIVDRLDRDTRISPYAPVWRSTVCCVLGSTVACLSKAEFSVAVLGTCVVYCFLTSRREPQRSSGWSIRRALSLTGLAIGPSSLVLLIVGVRVGHKQLSDALGGYGVARLTCPWWPTGLGMLSIAATLARAVATCALGSLFRFRLLHARWGRKYVIFLAVAVLGTVIVRLQLPYALVDFAASQPRGISSIVLKARYFLSLTGFFLPVMWAAIAFTAFQFVGILRHHPDVAQRDQIVLFASAAILISSRSLFGDLFSRVPIVAQSAYPLWFIFSGILGMAFIRSILKSSSSRGALLLSAILLSYGCIRIANQLSTDRGSFYKTLETEAGPVRLRSYDVSAQLYREVLRVTGQDGRILEVPFGGGLTFASHRKGSLFLTQFMGLSPSSFIEALDLNAYRRSPPDLVIATDGPRLGSGKGIQLGCSFPRFGFAPPSHDPTAEPIHPSLALILREYRVYSRMGDRVLMIPRGGPNSMDQSSLK